MKQTLSLNKLKVAKLAEKMVINADTVKGGASNDCHIIIEPIEMPCDQLSGNGGFTG